MLIMCTVAYNLVFQDIFTDCYLLTCHLMTIGDVTTAIKNLRATLKLASSSLIHSACIGVAPLIRTCQSRGRNSNACFMHQTASRQGSMCAQVLGRINIMALRLRGSHLAT